jgi:hypothetical protein
MSALLLASKSDLDVNMKGLKGPTFATLNNGRENPVFVRRAKLVQRAQQKLRKAQAANLR